MENKILFNILPNEDNYSWKQLTCTFRPWMVAFNYYGKLQRDTFLLLTSFLQVYCDNKVDKDIMDFKYNYDKYIKDFMGIEIIPHQYDSVDDLINNIKKCIDQNQPVLVPSDLIALHYNPMYMLEHRFKCFLVKGYDLRRGLFYILDNIHIDYGSSTVLTDYVSKFQELYEMNEEYSIARKKEKCFYSLKRTEKKELNEALVLIQLGRIIAERYKDKENIIYWEKELLKNQNNIDGKKIDEIIKILDFKYVFNDKLNKLLLSVVKDNNIVRDIYNTYASICLKWEEIRKCVLYTKTEDNDKIYDEIIALENKEKDFMHKLQVILSNIPVKQINTECKTCKYIIQNNSQAQICYEENSYKIIHSKLKKYDTWQMQDNACQLLIDGKKRGSFQVTTHSETCFGEDIHYGIIIKMKSSKKYLFGNLRGSMIAIYCPEMQDKFEIFMQIKLCGNANVDDIFRVDYSEDKISFYYADNEKAIYELEIKNDGVQYIGMFSKTWEYLEHTVNFYNIITK